MMMMIKEVVGAGPEGRGLFGGGARGFWVGGDKGLGLRWCERGSGWYGVGDLVQTERAV